MRSYTIQHYDTLDSTNTRARRLVESGEAPAGLVVVANEQTAGRGQRGAPWVTVPGASLAASLVIARPDLPRPSRITLLAALAAARSLEALGSQSISIKWPNDLMRQERKIGGLLVEGVHSPSGEAMLVVGLGVNLSLQPGDLPSSLRSSAGDAGLPADTLTRDALLMRVLEELDRLLDGVGTKADQAAGEEYRQRSWLRGRRVCLDWAGKEEHVEIADVTGEGDLILADGRTARGEEVRLIPQP
ncbi:MAG: biotin--[acetyl-CoA-carboxylase] ligase [Planctomycetota bacterium]|nr:biotin--[acetyl-CoA-carboxylase] ligase [Planctomycetota bacterium]